MMPMVTVAPMQRPNIWRAERPASTAHIRTVSIRIKVSMPSMPMALTMLRASASKLVLPR